MGPLTFVTEHNKMNSLIPMLFLPFQCQVLACSLLHINEKNFCIIITKSVSHAWHSDLPLSSF